MSPPEEKEAVPDCLWHFIIKWGRCGHYLLSPGMPIWQPNLMGTCPPGCTDTPFLPAPSEYHLPKENVTSPVLSHSAVLELDPLVAVVSSWNNVNIYSTCLLCVKALS